MILEVLICTIDRGIDKLVNLILPPIPDVIYQISWQLSDKTIDATVPVALQRDDIRIFQIEGRGLSKNRNNAIKNAIGDVCLISDDDVKYELKYFDRITETFEEHPTIDIATFKSIINEQKVFPSFSFDLREIQPNYYVSSFEIAFRRHSIQGKLKFNELFGLGAPVLGAAEEEVFIYDALKMDLHCQYFPIEIVKHKNPSTGTGKEISDKVIMAKGAYIEIAYPGMTFIRCVMNAKRLSNTKNVSFLHALRCLLKGKRYAKKNKMS